MTVKLIIFIFVIGFILNSTGDDIVKKLKKRYNDVAEKCYSLGKEKPAYECSGILIRGVSNSSSLDYAWDMTDLNKKKKAFSVSYLRRDQQFAVFSRGYDSGFIIYPHSQTPRKKNKYNIYCAFPTDANVERRKGHGCGKNYVDRSHSSNHCHKQNIKSLDDWKSHYYRIMKSSDKYFVTRQCAFDMTLKSAAKYFIVSLKANQYLKKISKKYAFRNNELRMHAWNDTNSEKIPIEAFFYIIGSAKGKELAEKYQDQFYARGGGGVPIVGIRLPSAKKSFKVKYHKRKLK